MTHNHIEFQSESENESETQSLPAPVAIIGASLTGLSLALSLLQSNLYRPTDITIYDQRRAPARAAPSPQPTTSNLSGDSTPAQCTSPTSTPAAQSSSGSANGYDPATTASGVILTPNGLRVLDALAILDRVRARCWTSVHRTYRADSGPDATDGDGAGQGEGDKLVRKVQVSGEEVYGYRNHRLWRSVLVGAMLDMVVGECGVDVRWGWRFQGLADGGCNSDPAATERTAGAEQVKFLVKSPDGAREARTAGLLVGADGIYSSVRGVLHPHAAPVYTGTTGVLAHIRWDEVAWPRVEDGNGNNGAYERQCTLQGAPGALFWIPEDAAGSVVMVGKQVKMEDANDRSRDEWERLARDKAYLSGFYRQDYEQWGSTGRKVIDAVCANSETLYLWPFMRMAKLDTWFSISKAKAEQASAGKEGNAVVIIMGDAAHALPPSSGQGVNQTLEDVYVLTQVLETVKTGAKPLAEALQFWQRKRQERVDAVFDWATNATNVQRLPRAEREKLMQSGAAKSQQETDDMRWLYKPDWDAVVAEWRTA